MESPRNLRRSADERARYISCVLQIVYTLLNGFLLILYAFRGDLYLSGLALGTFVLFPVIHIFYRLTGFQRIYRLEILIFAFTLISYTGGELLHGYANWAHYDKIAHTLSGSFVALLAMPLFYMLKNNHALERGDCYLIIVFCFSVSMAVAGLWEIGEYIVSRLTGRDVQRFLTTGIADTMMDMIVCLIGTLFVLPSMRTLYRTGMPRTFMRPFEEFIRKNPKFENRLQRPSA